MPRLSVATLLKRIASLEKELSDVKRENNTLTKTVERLSKDLKRHSELLESNKLSLIPVVQLNRISVVGSPFPNELSTRFRKQDYDESATETCCTFVFCPNPDPSQPEESDGEEGEHLDLKLELKIENANRYDDFSSENDDYIPDNNHFSNVLSHYSYVDGNTTPDHNDDDTECDLNQLDAKLKRKGLEKAAERVKRQYDRRKKRHSEKKDALRKSRRRPVIEFKEPETRLERSLANYFDEIAETTCAGLERHQSTKTSRKGEKCAQIQISPNGWDSCRNILFRKISNFAEIVLKEDSYLNPHGGVKKFFNKKDVILQDVLDHPLVAPSDSDNIFREGNKRSKGKYVCSVCAKILSSSGNLKIHMKAHEGDKPFTCNLCDASFPLEATYRRHLLIHEDKNLQCPQCEAKFRRKDDMTKHIRRIHEKIKQFTCSMCPKTFADSSGKLRHERRHLGLKPHLCVECGRKFPEIANLRLHMKTQHSGLEKPNRVKLLLVT